MLACVCPISGLAQNAPGSPTPTRQRTTTPKQTSRANVVTSQQTSTTTTTQTTHARAASRRVATNQTNGNAQEFGAREVLAAFDALVQGIERADVNAVTAAYWNSPQLMLFNYNGTVTKTWEQLRKNRASSYPETKNVRLDIRDRRAQMLSPGVALVTCMWTQSQTFRSVPETASGRMTLVYRRFGNSWKIVHLHTSPDAPDPSRVPVSEQTPASTPSSSSSPQPATP
jgi:ketosteroid isomerase-like protein